MKPEEVRFSSGVAGSDAAQPVDRLTRLADVGRKAMEADPEWDKDDMLVISLDSATDNSSALCILGFGLDAEEQAMVEKIPDPELRATTTEELISTTVVAVLFHHVEALLAKIHGHEVRVVPLSVTPGQVPPPMHTQS